MEFVRPQLAKSANDRFWAKWSPNDYVAEFKLDGHRRLISMDHCWSRLGNESFAPELQEQLPSGWLLDAEIVPTDCKASSNVVSHYLAEHPDKLKLVVFDVLWADGSCVMTETWEERRQRLLSFFHEQQFARIELSQVFTLLGQGSIDDLMSAAAEYEHEGIILKKRNAPYKPNSRSAWVKHKFIETFDVVITDCESDCTQWTVRPGHVGTDGVLYPEGKRSSTHEAGFVGLSYGWTDTEGNLKRAGSLGWTGKREDIEKHVGRVAECKSYGPVYPTGALRHPGFLRWRDDDKAAEDCVFDFVKGEVVS